MALYPLILISGLIALLLAIKIDRWTVVLHPFVGVICLTAGLGGLAAGPAEMTILGGALALYSGIVFCSRHSRRIRRFRGAAAMLVRAWLLVLVFWSLRPSANG